VIACTCIRTALLALHATVGPPPLQELHGLQMSKLALKHNGKALIDPFSIADCPSLLKPDADVVEVQLLE
jgi:hypothetical protein